MSIVGTKKYITQVLHVIDKKIMYFWYIFQGSLDDYNETVKLAKDAWKSWAMVLKFNSKFKLINKVQCMVRI